MHATDASQPHALPATCTPSQTGDGHHRVGVRAPLLKPRGRSLHHSHRDRLSGRRHARDQHHPARHDPGQHHSCGRRTGSGTAAARPGSALAGPTTVRRRTPATETFERALARGHPQPQWFRRPGPNRRCRQYGRTARSPWCRWRSRERQLPDCSEAADPAGALHGNGRHRWCHLPAGWPRHRRRRHHLGGRRGSVVECAQHQRVTPVHPARTPATGCGHHTRRDRPTRTARGARGAGPLHHRCRAHTRTGAGSGTGGCQPVGRLHRRHPLPPGHRGQR